MTTSTAPKITRGTTFRYLIADANVLFKVTDIDAKRGRVTTVAVNEPFEHNGVTFDSEYAGTVRDFLIEEVRALVGRQTALDALFKGAKDADTLFWESVNVGDVLHYDSSFGQWVRGTVVLDDHGHKAFRPTALVGDTWRAHDLYTVDIDGDVRHGYHARKVIDGNVWQPNTSEFYEAGRRRRTAPEEDPRTLPERSLTPPAPTAEQQAEYAKGARVKALREALNDYTLTVDQVLARARDIVTEGN